MEWNGQKLTEGKPTVSIIWRNR